MIISDRHAFLSKGHLFVPVTIIFIFFPATAFAELSAINKWRIEQAILKCKETNNELTYNDYWRDVVTDKNRDTLCLGEQFAGLAALDADKMIESKGLQLLETCREGAKGDKKAYYGCLKKNLNQTAQVISAPCDELAAAKLWEGKNCRNLISYIITKNFQVFMDKNRPLHEKVLSGINRLKNNKAVTTLFNPLTAIMLFIVYGLHIVFLIDPGNWMRVSKAGLVVGPFILLSYFIPGGARFLSAGLIVLLLTAVTALNHRKFIVKRKRMHNW